MCLVPFLKFKKTDLESASVLESALPLRKFYPGVDLRLHKLNHNKQNAPKLYVADSRSWMKLSEWQAVPLRVQNMFLSVALYRWCRNIALAKK